MKKIIIWSLLPFLMLACNSPEPAPAPSSSNKPAQKVTPQLFTGTKSVFKKVELLPSGIENIFGKAPSKENGFYKFSFPRQDLSVTIDGTKIDPRFAFTTWFSFMPVDTTYAMLMGDVVLLETEFKAVLKKLDERGIDIAAIHNHLLNEKPKIMYLHVTAMGNPVDLLAKLKEVLALTATPVTTSYSDTASNIDWRKTEEILGYTGKREDNILKFSIPRAEKIKDQGMEVPENMGINSVINFQKMGNKAALTGDFVLTYNEVNTVQKILTRNNILVTAIHNHMLFEDPRLFFMHFWAVDEPEKLATVLHEVLNNTNHEGKK